MVAQNKKTPAIQLEEISRIYQMAAGEVAALARINLIVEQGEYLAVMGPSGSGKTTLLNLLGCLDQPTSGRYYLGGEDVSALPDDRLSGIRNRKIGFIFQSYNLIPELTVLENIEIPLLYRNPHDPDGLQRAVQLAEMVGFGSRLDHRPAQLSGGQQQRVAIGEGASYEAQQRIKQMGSLNIIVRSVKPPAEAGKSSQHMGIDKYGLLKSDFPRLQTIPSLSQSAQLRRTRETVWQGEWSFPAQLVSTNPSYFQLVSLSLSIRTVI